jgi:hypothetical protein
MHSPEHHQEHTPLRQLEPRAVGPHDPVCGMVVSNDSQFSTQYEGRTNLPVLQPEMPNDLQCRARALSNIPERN